MTIMRSPVVEPDWKTRPRVRDPEAMRARHIQGGGCELALEDHRDCVWPAVSIHHVLKRTHGGDDVLANFVLLCGDGTTGHHGLIEAEDDDARAALGRVLVRDRQDTIAYLRGRLGWDRADEWLRRRLFV